MTREQFDTLPIRALIVSKSGKTYELLGSPRVHWDGATVRSIRQLRGDKPYGAIRFLDREKCGDWLVALVAVND